jgi:hypothetical protein
MASSSGQLLMLQGSGEVKPDSARRLLPDQFHVSVVSPDDSDDHVEEDRHESVAHGENDAEIHDVLPFVVFCVLCA